MKYIIAIIIAAVLFFAGVATVAYVQQAQAATTPVVGTSGSVSTQTNIQGRFDLFVATTTNATSTPKVITGAKKVTLFVSRGDTTGTGNGGSEIMQIQVKDSGSGDWVTFNKLIDNVANTNAQTLTRVTNMSLAAGTSTKTYTMDLGYDAFDQIRCVRVETTDGEGTCSALVQW